MLPSAHALYWPDNQSLALEHNSTSPMENEQDSISVMVIMINCVGFSSSKETDLWNFK